jgi:hypothetical protein
MPLVSSVSQYEFTAPVIYGAYRWFFTEQTQDQLESVSWGPFNLATVSFVAPPTETRPELCVDDSLIFKQLADQWRVERGSTSSTTEMVLCTAYQSIIGMGPGAIPLILSKLESEGDDPDHWFWALQVLTRANPVSEEDEGNLLNMRRAWFTWAAAEGYAW